MWMYPITTENKPNMKPNELLLIISLFKNQIYVGIFKFKESHPIMNTFVACHVCNFAYLPERNKFVVNVTPTMKDDFYLAQFFIISFDFLTSFEA